MKSIAYEWLWFQRVYAMHIIWKQKCVAINFVLKYSKYDEKELSMTMISGNIIWLLDFIGLSTF